MFKALLVVMGIFTLICVCLVSLFTPSPLRKFGQEPQAPLTYVTTFDSVTLQRLQNGPPFPQVAKQAVTGDDINLSRPLRLMGGSPDAQGAWPAFLHNLKDGRIDTHPLPMEVAEVANNDELSAVCGYPPATRYPVLKYPMPCPEGNLGTPQDEVLVLPNGYTGKLQQFAAAHTQRDGWLLASVIAGLKYADHLRYEMNLVGVTWPENATVNQGFDYCVAGISLRAVFPAIAGDVDLTALVAALDELVYHPDNRAASYAKFAIGFKTGKLDQCVSAA